MYVDCIKHHIQPSNMPPRKKRENRDTDDGPRKRRRAVDQEEDRVVISNSDEDEDFRPTSSSLEERKREKESKTRSNEMTEEEMLDLAMRLSEQEANNTALRQRQEEEAMRKAIAESLYADSPTHPHSESLLADGSPTQQCQSSPPEAESSIQPPRRKLSYPNLGVADREGAHGVGVNVGVALPETRRRGKKEGSPLLDMPDLSQTQKFYSQSSPLSQSSTSMPLSSQEEGSSLKNPFGDLSAHVESQDRNATENDSQSQLRKKSTVPSASKLILCLHKLSQDLLVDCQASGFLLRSQEGPPSLTLSTKSQMSQSSQPKSPTFSKSPVFSRTERGAGEEPGQGSPPMFSETDSGKEEKEASPTFPKSAMFSSSDTGEEEKVASPTFPRSPVFPRTDKIRDQGPQSCIESVSTTEDYEDRDREDVKSSDSSKCLPPHLRTTLSLNKRLMPIRKTVGVADKVVDQEEREAAEEDLNSEELALALETQPMQELTSNMALRWSDDDEEEDGPAKSAHSSSTVFPQENDLPQPSNQGRSTNTHYHRSPPHIHSPCLVPKKRTHTSEDSVCEEGDSQSKRIRKKFTFKAMYGAPSPFLPRQAAGRGSQDEAQAGNPSSHQPQASSSRLSPPTGCQGDGAGVVCYYWGVPFCPRGQDPDAYTQVIMSQLEVYEKSLKEAQRGLLRKAGWGEPVLPGPPERPFSRRGRPKRHRAPRPLEEEEEEEEEQGRGKQQEEVVAVVEDDEEEGRGKQQEEVVAVVENDEEEGRGKQQEEVVAVVENDEEEGRGKQQEEVVAVVENYEEEGEKRERRLSRWGTEEGGRRGRLEWKDCQALFVSTPEQEEKSPSPVFHVESSQQLILPRRRLGLRREERRPSQLPDPLEREKEENEKRDEEEEEGMGEEVVDVGGLEVPETQLSDDGTQNLMVTSPAQPQPERQSLPQIQTFLSPPHRLERRVEGMEVDEERRSGPVRSPAGGDVRMEMEETGEVQGGVPEPAPPQSPSMDCPMCMRPFPLTEIEMHAAYCDGSTANMEEEEMMGQESQSQVAVKSHRKRTRRGEIIGEEQPSSSGSGKAVQGEKCFLCQQLFNLRDYEKHVEDCIRNQEVSKVASRAGQSGDLLSALDQTEHRDSGTAKAGPCDIAFRNQHSGLIEDLGESGGSGDIAVPGFRVSTSPIRSFTSISEATDCLIDFKRQYSSSTSSSSSSRPRQRGRKFKRKFK
ncbi:BRCA1-A complex subunit RAP80 isoform X2 [Coregonus clupeaformis]|uniref:BRCA1-A complex subunit RAP80 isoform X2 n=1 Tax=Coregonus clupeaformis TaxID=59861 RepID=UPI001BE0863D|nr:BRCA1-A complex subunit RAP80 isoform X2 [Coregonus clupeaformis]